MYFFQGEKHVALLLVKYNQQLKLLSILTHLSCQDDSDDEPPSSKRAYGHADALEFMDLSCEEGEETASSEVHSEVSHFPLSTDLV